MVKFLRYILRYSESNMYLAIEDDEALLIDPHCSEEVMTLLKKNRVNNLCILLTHEHFDHISGVNWYKKKISTIVICQSRCADSIGLAKNNRPFVFLPMVENKTEKEKQEILTFYDSFPVESIEVDVSFDDCYNFKWHDHYISMQSCPGHSRGSSVILFDNTYAFTGDYMIPDAPVILRFPGGSKEQYKQKTEKSLLDLPEELIIMPGHGEPCRRKDLIYSHGCFMKCYYD